MTCYQVAGTRCQGHQSQQVCTHVTDNVKKKNSGGAWTPLSYSPPSLGGIANYKKKCNKKCRGGCRCDLIPHVRRRRKGHGLEWLEADMGFNESPLLSFSQPLCVRAWSGGGRQRKWHKALCGRHEHWLPSPQTQTHRHTDTHTHEDACTHTSACAWCVRCLGWG